MNPAVNAQSLLAPAPSPYHHGSHRNLLTSASVDSASLAQVDAIVVPTARHPASLRTALELSAKLGCTLVALCSKWASADETVRLARWRRVNAIVIDTGRLRLWPMPRFRTTELLAGTRFEQRADTSLKRNLGLLLARLIGWERIVFLDDDIVVPEPSDLNRAVGLLGPFAGAGLSNGGFPDNSVVCHAYRATGGPQETFIGGGALAVGLDSVTSFFPNVYNEDWFFLLDDAGLRRSTVSGLAFQQPYDPFANPMRARLEEFGDALAEGVFWLLDQGKRVQDADVTYWRASLDRRQRFINEVLEGVESMCSDVSEKGRMISALKAARGRCQLIPPSLCVRYLRAWQLDREMWRSHVDALYQVHYETTLRRPEMALSALGLTRFGEYMPRGRRARWKTGDMAQSVSLRRLTKT